MGVSASHFPLSVSIEYSLFFTIGFSARNAGTLVDGLSTA
jgi:hypothetical protein